MILMMKNCKKERRMTSIKPLLLSTALIITLTACESSPFRELNTGDPVNPEADKARIMESARNVAMEKKYAEVRHGDLDAAEEAYRAAPNDVYAAMSYAKILRRVNRHEQADLILKPYAADPAQAGEDVLLEYSKLKLAMGDFDTAQMMAQEANFISNSSESLMLLGVALDAQGHHTAGEKHLRQELDKVGMDVALKSKIQNNLAVSLMAQGRRNEASVILSQIQDTASNNLDTIEANRQLAEQL